MVDQPLWKMMDFVSWDDEIPNWMENKIHVPNHQPESVWNNSEVCIRILSISAAVSYPVAGRTLWAIAADALPRF